MNFGADGGGGVAVTMGFALSKLGHPLIIISPPLLDSLDIYPT